MKIKGTVIGGTLSGTSGNVVAASWKGINYVRTRVIPKNPDSTDQRAQRLAWRACVNCYQHLDDDLKGFLDKLGTDRQLAGFNVYMTTGVHDERADFAHIVIPPNRYAPPITGVTFAKGSAAGSINITWDEGDWIAADIPIVFYRLHHPVDGETPAFNDNPWVLATIGAVTMATKAYVLTGLTQAAYYSVAIVPNFAATETRDQGYGGGACKKQQAKET